MLQKTSVLIFALVVAAHALANEPRIGKAEVVRLTPASIDIDLTKLESSSQARSGGQLDGPFDDRALPIDRETEADSPADVVRPILGMSVGGLFAEGHNPASVGDIGLNHYVQMSGPHVAIFDRTGRSPVSPFRFGTLWSSVGGPCANPVGNAMVRYDVRADRWLISQLDIHRRYQCIAVSKNGDPVRGGWYLYSFALGGRIVNDARLAVGSAAYFLSTKGWDVNSIAVFAFEREAMLRGDTAQVVAFDVPGLQLMLLPVDFEGKYRRFPAPPESNYFVRHIDGDLYGGADRLQFFFLSVNWARANLATFGESINVPVAPFDSILCTTDPVDSCIDQPAPGPALRAYAADTMWRAQFRHDPDRNEVTITTNHTVDVTGARVAGIRWYQLRWTPSTGLTLMQQGTYLPDNIHRWLGSAAVDGSGNLAIVYNVSGTPATYPGLRAAVRRADSPAGTLDAEIALANGASTFGSANWASHNSIDVDPLDDCTFWFSGSYMTDAPKGEWRTGVRTFTMPNCTGPEGSLVIANWPSSAFAYWSSLPGVRRFTGDFNGDGRTDFGLLGFAEWDAIPIAFSNGEGTFNVTAHRIDHFNGWLKVPKARLLVGHFNEDDKEDIALTGGEGWTTLPVAFSAGDGRFEVKNAPSSEFASWTANPTATPLVGHFNEDDLADIAVVGGTGWTSIPVAFSKGNGEFTVRNKTVDKFGEWARVANVRPYIGDFNADHKADIVLIGPPGWTTLPIAFSKGDGTFTVTNESVGSFVNFATDGSAQPFVADFDGDRKTDVALAGGPGRHSIRVAFSTDKGAFKVMNEPIVSFGGWASVPGVKRYVGDFDGDGKADIGLTGVPGWTTMPFAFSNGNGTFSVTNRNVLQFPQWSSEWNAAAFVGDFDGNGKHDIALNGSPSRSSIPVAFSISN